MTRVYLCIYLFFSAYVDLLYPLIKPHSYERVKLSLNVVSKMTVLFLHDAEHQFPIRQIPLNQTMLHYTHG